MREWLQEKLKDGPTHINVQEIEEKAPEWNMSPLQATLAFKDLRGELWQGEFVTVDEHPAGYVAAWVERVY